MCQELCELPGRNRKEEVAVAQVWRTGGQHCAGLWPEQGGRWRELSEGEANELGLGDIRAASAANVQTVAAPLLH